MQEGCLEEVAFEMIPKRSMVEEETAGKERLVKVQDGLSFCGLCANSKPVSFYT